MGVKMSAPCFELVDWTDLLVKAGSDLSRLETLVSSYDVFNCLCTLNHIPDWISKDEKQNASVKEAAANLKQNPKVDAVRQLCNRAKHFKVADKSPRTRMEVGFGAGRYGRGDYGVGEPSYTAEVDGQTMSVLDLLRDVAAEWEKLRFTSQSSEQ
jgi:hypothetical protein